MCSKSVSKCRPPSPGVTDARKKMHVLYRVVTSRGVDILNLIRGEALVLTMNRPTSGSFLTATGKQLLPSLPSFSSGELELEWRAACRLEQNQGFSEHLSHL